MDDIVRHATEIGIAGFTFVLLAPGRQLDEKRKYSKTQRWRAIAKSAAGAERRLSVPGRHATP